MSSHGRPIGPTLLATAFCVALWLAGPSFAAQANAPAAAPAADKKQKISVGTEIELIMPAKADRGHIFYRELLREALSAAGYEPRIHLTQPVPPPRAVLMLDRGEASIHPMFATPERDARYTPVRVDLTEGLIAKRILLVPKGQAIRFAKVRTLADFRASGAVGAFGSGWYDTEIWRANDLGAMVIEGDWSSIYGMLSHGGRGFDYFSRGLTEISTDERLHPELDVEQNLLFTYEGDFRFYLSASASRYRDVIEDSLKKAVASGLLHKLIVKHFSGDLDKYRLASRTVLKLTSPAALPSRGAR